MIKRIWEKRIKEDEEKENWKLELRPVNNPKERFHKKLRIVKVHFDKGGNEILEVVHSLRGILEPFIKGYELDSQHKSAPDFHIALGMMGKRHEEIVKGKKKKMYTYDEIAEIIKYNRPKF